MGLLDFFSQATPTDPMRGLLGAAYSDSDIRAARTSEALRRMSQALLNPAPNAGGGIGGSFATLGTAAANAGAGYREGPQYLQQAAAQEIQTREEKRKAAEEQRKVDEDARSAATDASIAKWVHAQPPEMQKMISDDPALGAIAYKEAMQQLFNTTGGAQGVDYSKEVTWGIRDGKYVPFQTSKGGGMQEVKVPEGVEMAGPGGGAQQGAEAKDFIAAQNQITTAMSNIAEVPALIQGIKETPELEEWGTGVPGYLFRDLPANTAQAIQKRTEQLKAISLFAKIPELRGLGAMSNVDAQTATSAMNRMDTATTYEEYMSAMHDYEDVMGRMFIRNQRMAQSGDWSEMNKIRAENNAALKFEPSIDRPPTIPLADWKKLTRENKLRVYEAWKAGQDQ